MKEREKLNILLVDDKPENLMSLEAVLESPDLNIIKAMSGNEALSLMLEHDFALVLLDVQMPEMNGFETAVLMRKSEKTKYLPIIFVTGIYKEENHIFKGYESGAVDYLFKPLDTDILRSKVNVFLELHRQKKLLAKTTGDLKQTVEELTKTKYHLDNIIESSSDSIVVTDNTGNLIRVNQSFLELLGYMEEEVIGRHTSELSPSEEGTYESTTGEIVVISEEFFNETKIMHPRLLEEGKAINSERYFIRKDQKIVPVEINIAFLFNKEGDFNGSVGILRDITARRKSEMRIKESRDFLENIFKTSADGIMITNNKGKITMVNGAVEKILGYSRSELVGRHSGDLTPEREIYKEEGKEFITKLFEDGIVIGFEHTWLKKDRSLVTIELSAALLKDGDGNRTGSVASIRNITERKEMEHKLIQSEKLKSLGELAGGVAHDFNNVLAAILGRAQLLKMVVEPPPGEEERRKSVIELKEGLHVIEQASRDGAETVRRIQEFARKRDDDKHFNTVDLNKIVDNSLDFTKMKWKDNAESKGIKINIQKEFSILPTTSGSSAELREVFTNLINNAVDAMPQGGDIKIKTYKEDGHIVVNLEDTGVGIPKALRNKIFDPFFTTKGVQSTGLGMSVSYGIISRHRGTISVDSIEGRGAAFIIKLPIIKNTIKEEKVKPISGEIKKARILVIEDEDGVRNLLSAILKKSGHEVETATRGAPGIEMFEKKEFDLVFTDLGMPGMSGWQVAEKVKGINGRVPVVLITGWDIRQEESEMKDSYVDLIIHKPFEMDQVFNVVQEGMILRDRFKSV